MSDFSVLSLFNVRSVKLDLMVNVEKTTTTTLIHFLVIYLAQFYVI